MSHAIFHAKSSVARWGGAVEDYLPIHQAMDSMKMHVPDNRHRLFLHHTGIIPLMELAYGAIVDGQRMPYIVNSRGSSIPVQYIVIQHLAEDYGEKGEKANIPTAIEILEMCGIMDESNLHPALYQKAFKISRQFDGKD